MPGGSRRVSVEVDANVSPFVRGLTSAGAAAKGFAHELESADGRMANLVQTGLALAPALVPLGAAAVPAIAGLTTQLGFAVAGAGTAVLAFQGVGDALGALNDYAIDPTAEHFEKLQQTMDALGPAGQEFVLAMQKLRPELQGLQDIAQQGLLPGVTEGIDELMELMPQAEQVIGTIATTMGNLAAEAGDNLNDQRWVDFIQFLNVEAAPTLQAMGRTLGNFVEGMANLVVAFNPLADDFTGGLLDMSRAFADWTANLAQTEGLQEFTAYIQENGPRALDVLASLGGALVEFVEAAAPVGSVALPIISALADTLAAIADSPVGPVLITTAAAVGTLGRSLALLKTVGLRGGDSLMSNIFSAEKMQASVPVIGGLTKATRELRTAQEEMAVSATKARDAQSALIPTKDKRQAITEYAVASQKVATAERNRAAAMRATAGQAGKAAGVVAGLAVATTGLADKTGLSNTASLALMGTIAGPWGAAIGGGVGLVMDLAAANNDLEGAIRSANAAASSTPINFAVQRQAIEGLREASDEYVESVNNVRGSNALIGLASPITHLTHLGDTIKSVSDLWTHASEEGRKAQQEQVEGFMALRQGAAELFAELNGGDLSMLHATDEELTEFITTIAPAAAQAGIDIREALTTHEGWDALVNSIRTSVEAMDSASGKSQTVADALADLGSEMTSNVSQAEALRGAMDALFGVELSQSAATDAWVQSLRDMREAVQGAGRDLLSNSQAALTARDGIRGYVNAMIDKAEADAAATGNGRLVAKTLLQTRDNIVATARAANVSEKDIKALVKQMGLTPENMTTIVTADGVLKAQEQIKALGKLYDLTPSQVKTMITQAGMDPSQAEIKALAHLYDITPKQVRTIIDAVDQASGVASRVASMLSGLDGNVYETIIRTRYETVGARHNVNFEADGGVLDFYANGGLRENHVAQIAPAGSWRVWGEPETGGEAYIPLASSKRPRSRAIATETVGRLGGSVEWFADGGFNLNLDQRLAAANLEQQIHQLRRDLAKDGKDSLRGLERKVAALQLKAAQRDLRQARREPFRTVIGGLRDARGEFDLSGDMSVRDVRAEVRDFRRTIREAGGEWSKRLDRMGDRAVHWSKKIHASERAIDRETKRRDKISDSLDEQQQALDNLRSTMEQFGSQVAGNFLSDPFNLSITPPAGVSSPAPVDPALIAARDQLGAAESRLAGIRSRTDLDPLERSYLASRAVAEVANLRDQVERLDRGSQGLAEASQQAVSGVDALTMTLHDNISAVDSFIESMSDLRGVLDPDFYSSLAMSGDFGTAAQLAGLPDAQLAEINALWMEREDKVAQLATITTQEVYGRQEAILTAGLDKTVAALDRANHHIANLNNRVDRQTARLEAVEERVGRAIQSDIQDVRRAIADIPRQTRDLKRGGKGRG